MVLGKLHKVNNDDMKNKECNDVINTVLRENSYIDIVQVSSGLSALKFCFFSFLIWNAILLSFKLWLYEAMDYDTTWLRYPLLILIFSTSIIALLFSNLTFWRCFSHKRMQGIIPIQSKFHFVNICNWYANATICMSTIVSIGFVFMISFYDECFYNLKIALNNYKAFGISENESVLGFVNDSLTNFQHTSMLLKCCYLFTFIILLAFLIVMFYAMRIAKPIIFTVDINRSTQDICDTIKPDGISI